MRLSVDRCVGGLLALTRAAACSLWLALAFRSYLMSLDTELVGWPAGMRDHPVVGRVSSGCCLSWSGGCGWGQFDDFLGWG